MTAPFAQFASAVSRPIARGRRDPNHGFFRSRREANQEGAGVESVDLRATR